MKKLAFVGNSEPPERLLELFKKMTPNKSGVWGQLQGVDNYKDADYFAVIDYIPNSARSQIDESKCIFLGAHPETMSAYKNMDDYKGLKMYDAKNTIGFLEWWIKYDYDYLTNLQPMTKTKVLGSIVSNARSQSYHIARIEWLKRFTSLMAFSSNPQEAFQQFDLYGRIVPDDQFMNDYYRGACGSLDPRGAASSGGNDHMTGKEEVYETHKYMIEFDATGEHYFSERVLDCILLWSMPIYWGGNGLQKYLPENSFKLLNIDGNGQDVIEIAHSDFYEKNIDNLAKARDVLLNKLQIWARVHEAIFGVCK